MVALALPVMRWRLSSVKVSSWTRPGKVRRFSTTPLARLMICTPAEAPFSQNEAARRRPLGENATGHENACLMRFVAERHSMVAVGFNPRIRTTNK